MTVTSELSTDPGFEGLYKYTVTGSWDVTQYGLSHIDFFLTLKDLECICDPRVAQFATPAGTSNGEGDRPVHRACRRVQLRAPEHSPELRATIKFPVSRAGKRRRTGTGSSIAFPPSPYSVDPEGVAIKHGQQVCLGALAGTMPMGDCSTPAETKSWGGVKAIYR
jgi:hypothetical protein